MRSQLFFTTLLITVTSLAAPAQEITTARKAQFNSDRNNVAIKGYDPVAYFYNHAAIRGTKDLSVYYQGIIYYFSSAANKEEFKNDPSKYEPAYGGWCAYAMGAKGEKVTIDPGTFRILDGKLYLFYNRNFTNTALSWDKEEATLKSKADINWKNIFH